TTLAQIAAEELGISLDAVGVTSGDTSTTSFDEGCYASMTLYNNGSAVKAAAADVKRKVILKAAEMLKVKPGDLELKKGRIYSKANPEKSITLKELVREACEANRGNVAFIGEASFENTAFPPNFGAQFVEVEVDTETGQIEILKVVAFQEHGKSINPMVVEGQIEGALQQSIGYALTEDPIHDKLTGKMLNPSFHNYMVLTALDMPRMEFGSVEPYEPSGPFGAKGMSELPYNGAAPAIANAIYNAVGVRLAEIPMTPERVFRALKGLHHTE
ncbi:xanthine dehydrogenase family protein molybdopterin-binding subunit, partial [Chloroflexota bacterium]